MSDNKKQPAKLRSKVPWWNRPQVHKWGMVVIIVAGLGLLSARAQDWLMWRDSQGWTPHDGEVVRIAKPRPSSSGSKPQGGFGAPKTAEAKWVVFTYTYEVEGRQYTSSKVSYAISGESVPMDWLADLPGKGKAKVYVEPSTPSMSVLRVGDDFQYWNVRLAIGLFMVLGGGVRLAYKLAGL